jgi:RNA 2',3'-cyclic 3'-phosphodiesterase
MIRLFAALSVPPEIGEGLVARQEGLPGARWRPLESLHITLRFFGAVAEPLAADLDDALALIDGAPLILSLTGAGVFEGDRGVRAVWAGVTAEPALGRLAHRCEIAARRVGLAAERRAYRPHVTLAYLSHANPAHAAAWVQANALIQSPSFTVSGFSLYSSWPTNEGSAYRQERFYALTRM